MIVNWCHCKLIYFRNPNEIDIDGLHLSDQQVNNNMLGESTAEGPHVICILQDQRTQHKETQLHSVENPTYGTKK